LSPKPNIWQGGQNLDGLGSNLRSGNWWGAGLNALGLLDVLKESLLFDHDWTSRSGIVAMRRRKTDRQWILVPSFQNLPQSRPATTELCPTPKGLAKTAKTPETREIHNCQFLPILKRAQGGDKQDKTSQI
jgi:hypothetical protein